MRPDSTKTRIKNFRPKLRYSQGAMGKANDKPLSVRIAVTAAVFDLAEAKEAKAQKFIQDNKLS